MIGEPCLVTCPKCHYQATWRPATQDFDAPKNTYLNCPEITEILDNDPKRSRKLGNDPRHCTTFFKEWTRVVRAENRKAPP